MKRSVSKKGGKVIEGAVEVLKSIGSLTEIVRVGAKMMLQSALDLSVSAAGLLRAGGCLQRNSISLVCAKGDNTVIPA